MLRYIIVYSYIIIFSGWIFNLLHIPAEIAKMIMQVMDFIPFLFLPVLFKLRRSFLVLPNTTVFWGIIFLFLFHSLFTTIMHGGNIVAACVHFGAMFRYAPLAAVLSRINLTDSDINTFLRYFKILSVILVGIGFVELIGGPSVSQYFMPITDEVSSINNIMDESSEINLIGGTLFGIFPNTVDYSFFLFISYIIISNISKLSNKFLVGLVYAVIIFFTGSKATLLIFLLVISIQLSRYRFWVASFWLFIFVSGAILIYKFWELFYWTVFIDSQSSRLGYIIFTLPDFLSEFSFDTFFGVSPDKELVWAKINSYANAPKMTWGIDHMTSFEDEFYVALPVYYGILGFGLILLFFVGLYKSLMGSKWKSDILKYGIIIKSLFVCLLIAPLFNQIIIIKPFSLFFWIIVGLITSQKGNAIKNYIK